MGNGRTKGGGIVLISISHPYGDFTPFEWRKYNVEHSDEIAKEVALKGHTPINVISALRYWDDDARFKKEDFVRITDTLFALCDALLYCGPSLGCIRELGIAKEQGKIIYYSVDEIPYANK